ncbi:uncharacterized protein LOC120932640 isoform X2 [Rana temporaria]|uniref:uncharacterized protein LOC120932640 isoform X2 n=1 Tax=Rana temporaria TaxID=8407 RepID=UPI001AACC4E6|nr:uncharacterized protein LOC120932640 isoform X2 [Rana temporaria]
MGGHKRGEEPALVTTRRGEVPAHPPLCLWFFVSALCFLYVCVCLLCSACLLCFTAQESMESCRGSGCLVSAGVLVSGEPEIWTVEDDTVTLQCIYSVDKGRTTMCWGRGDKSDASTESNDRDKQEGTSDPPVTEAGDPLCSENHDDDKSPTSVYTSLTPISPMKITPPPNAEAQSIKRVLHILLHILTMIAIPFTAVIVYKCKVKDKTPSTSAVSMAKLAASETDGGEP